GEPRDDDFFVILNGDSAKARIAIPTLPPGRRWHLLLDSGAEPPGDIYAEEKAPLFTGNEFELAAMATLVLISRPDAGVNN
ncbi:MAG: glycogen debranching enzyme, partial [Desulfurivibrionaceae bacterium]